MTYCLDINSPLVPSESDTIKLLDKIFPCISRPIIFKWATTQVCVPLVPVCFGLIFVKMSVSYRKSKGKTKTKRTNQLISVSTI